MPSRRLAAFVALLALLAWPACSTSSPGERAAAATASDAGTKELVDASSSGDAAPPRTEACLAQDAKLQAALDKARTSPNAMLTVRNEACGTSVYVSGDAANATTTSLWRIGSITKTYVSATILTLVKDGKVRLDDPLEKWAPGLPKTAGVTVRMLLDHTSGVFNYTEVPSFLDDLKRKWKPRELVDLALTRDAYFEPGKGWHYSNTNYVLLGMIVEASDGRKLGAAVRARALAPAKLAHTFFDGEEPIEGTLAKGFVGKVDQTFALDPSGPWAAGAMVATGADLCDWVGALYGSTAVLDLAGQKLLVDGAVDAGGVKYGLGVLLFPATITAGAGPALGHNGSINGYDTQAFWFGEKKTAICAVVNDSKKSANDVSLAALGALFP